MRPLNQIALAFVVFSSIVFAVPVELETRNIFTVFQELNRRFVRRGPTAIATAYRKYNKPLPQDVKVAAAQTTNDGTVTATPEQFDVEYLCPVTIGGQTLNLNFDTGSSDL